MYCNYYNTLVVVHNKLRVTIHDKLALSYASADRGRRPCAASLVDVQHTCARARAFARGRWAWQWRSPSPARHSLGTATIRRAAQASTAEDFLSAFPMDLADAVVDVFSAYGWDLTLQVISDPSRIPADPLVRVTH